MPDFGGYVILRFMGGLVDEEAALAPEPGIVGI